MGRTLGLDVGTRTIGLAVSDELGWTAQGLPTLARRGLAADLAALREVAREWDVERVVVGLPRNMNGSIGPQAQSVLDFAAQVKEAVGVPVVTWDERLSSVAAERTLLEADLSRKKRRAAVDRLAAVFILQGYLDRQAAVRVRRDGPADEPD